MADPVLPERAGRRMQMALRGVGALLLLDFLISLVMLATDKNLQTNFGAVPPYYSHWYGVLAMGLVDLVGAAVVLAVSTGGMSRRLRFVSHRNVALIALGWSVVAILAMVGIVTAASQVGLSQAEFTKYLFGVTAYPGALSYIPWLYDLLLAFYMVTAITALVAAILGRGSRPA